MAAPVYEASIFRSPVVRVFHGELHLAVYSQAIMCCRSKHTALKSPRTMDVHHPMAVDLDRRPFQGAQDVVHAPF